MKNNFLFLLFVVFCFSGMYSQTSYIQSKDKGRIVIDDDRNKIKIDWRDHYYKLYYHKPGEKKEESIKLKDIDSAMAGDYKINHLIIEKEEKQCFTIAESAKFKLVGGPGGPFVKVHNSSYSGGATFRYYITDNGYKVIETIDTYGKDASDNAYSKIMKYFADCPGLMNRIAILNEMNIGYTGLSKFHENSYKLAAENHGYVFRLFRRPFFTPCESKYKLVENGTSQTIANQEYSFEKVKSNSMDDLFSMKGTISIKDGYLISNVKQTSLKLKINSYQDGILICTNEKGIVLVGKIIPEVNTIKRHKYDTKITLILGQMEGDDNTIYYCQKK